MNRKWKVLSIIYNCFYSLLVWTGIGAKKMTILWVPTSPSISIVNNLKKRDFRGPDFFLVKDVDNRLRPSWVVWEEGGKYPNLIIELLSNSTAQTDRTLKKELYQDRFRTPEYFWFSPDNLEFAGYRLVGHQYQEIPVTTDGKRWSEELELYLGIENNQLRYFSREGDLIATPQETALAQMETVEQQKLLTEQQKQKAEQEKQRADRLSAYLESMGIDPDNLPD